MSKEDFQIFADRDSWISHYYGWKIDAIDAAVLELKVHKRLV